MSDYSGNLFANFLTSRGLQVNARKLPEDKEGQPAVAQMLTISLGPDPTVWCKTNKLSTISYRSETGIGRPY